MLRTIIFVLTLLLFTFTRHISNAQAQTTTFAESFDSTAVGSLPTGWEQWSSTGGKAFAVDRSHALSAANSLSAVLTRPSVPRALEARAWLTARQPANVAVSAAVFLQNAIPATIFARGSELDSSAPSYYAVSITYGTIGLKLLKVVGGKATTLAELRGGSNSWYSGKFATVTLFANGSNVRAKVRRNDNGQYLNAFGGWQAGQAWALNVLDPNGIAGGGFVGLGRLPGDAGTTIFDDFACAPVDADSRPPTIAISTPPDGSTASGVLHVQANATASTGECVVHFYVDNVLRAVLQTPPYTWDFDTLEIGNGPHVLSAVAYDAQENVSLSATVAFTTKNDVSPAASPPKTPRHYSHIRLAQVAYGGPPLNPADFPLLRSSVDLVITNPGYATTMSEVAPATPKMIYTNVSSLYLELLIDWLNFADDHGYRCEEPFYHVASATPYSGAGGSTQPVTWFWQVYTGGTTLTDQTRAAHSEHKDHTDYITLPVVGESLYLAEPDRFREINLKLQSDAGSGWSCDLEYPSEVDSNGKPTTWSKMTVLTDTTEFATRSGEITFDPPANWKAAALGDSRRLYYVRLRTLTQGKAPVISKVLGRDYVNAHGRNNYVIPAFDYMADADHDGYLNDAEYAHRRPGMDARFIYETRLLSYGQMRFATTPAKAGFRNWCVDYHVRYMNRCPKAAGLFMDNSDGRTSTPPGSVLEPVGAYSTDYGTLMRAIGRAIAPRWMICNSAGAVGNSVDSTLQNLQGYYEEFAIRPEADTYQRFETLAEMVAQRAKIAPGHYGILDSYPAGGSQTDPRTLMGTLAYYYLLADPKTNFLDYWGGWDTIGPWTTHWTPAAAYDIGQPTSHWSVFSSGNDPANKALTFKVYRRSFEHALVLYKPLSYMRGVTGTLADATATKCELGNRYQPLGADGKLMSPVTSISLRNGEGAILIGQ